MKQRCYNAKCKDYRLYGGKGVEISDEWLKDYSAFRNWSESNGYSEGLSIDRIDSNGNYEPSNCRWVNSLTQSNNTSRNIYFEYKGKRKTVSQWSAETGIPQKTLWDRLNSSNWGIEKALSCSKKL